MTLEFFQGSVGKTGTCFFSDPLQMSLFVCDFLGSIFPVKPVYFIIFQNSLKFLQIKLSLFSRTAEDLTSFLSFFSPFPGIWRENGEIYTCLVFHLGIEVMFLIFLSLLEFSEYIHKKCMLVAMFSASLHFWEFLSTLSHKQQLGIKFWSHNLSISKSVTVFPHSCLILGVTIWWQTVFSFHFSCWSPSF